VTGIVDLYSRLPAPDSQTTLVVTGIKGLFRGIKGRGLKVPPYSPADAAELERSAYSLDAEYAYGDNSNVGYPA
jgi:hypothetical protein